MAPLRRTRAIDLLVPLLVVGALTYVLMRTSYDSIPPLHYFTAAPIAVLAIVEFVIARRIHKVVRHDPDTKPMAAISIARCVALGKASSLVGAGVVGAVLAVIARVLPDASHVSAARSDLHVAVVLLIAALALVAAGLVLERSGVDPGNKTLNAAPNR